MMKPLRIVAAIGDILRIFSPAFLLPLIVSAFYDKADLAVGPLLLPRAVPAFLAAFLITTISWMLIARLTKSVYDEDLVDREAFITVGLGWLVVTAFAMIPFLAGGTFGSPVDAWFETMAGITTTGATVITGNLDEVPKSIMIWRAGLQYLGGMGIIVLSIAVLARLTHGGMQLLSAETPGPTVTKVRPKLAQTAKTLWGVYAVLSVVLFALLLVILLVDGFGGKSAFYEALLHTLSGISTGGFSNHSQSIGYFDNWLFEAVLIVFMLISGMNFTLHYYTANGHWRRMLKDPEWRFFMATFIVSSLVITGLVWRAAGFGLDALDSAFRAATFSTASVLTSTGFAVADRPGDPFGDWDQWPVAGQLLLLIMMITGGSAGSTSGGIKHVRILLLFKILRRQIRHLLHPRAVIPVRLGGRVIKEETLMTAVAFFFAFISITLGGAVVLVTTDPLFDGRLIDAISAAASSMGNTGPALGVVGPTDNYAALLPHSKILLSGLMWCGRLEVFTALLLFMPGSWQR